MDVVEWLRGLGLEQYAPAFRDNDIDGEVLRRLTGEDLRELGVTSIGHRRRLLDAIGSLGDRQRAGEELPASAPAAAGEAERRQLTVMFCDLVGSTALSTRFDPEDLREMIGAYHRCVANTVARFAGFVAKYMGDGVLIYFGYPQAHEDDAERAVRSGLAVIDAVGNLSAPERLNVRLGVASGLVVVGDLIGAGAAQERGVVGETPNLAARLQGLAQSDTLVIAESTRRQIGSLFEITDLGPQQLAGFAEPQHVWRVVGESGVLSRFEALRSEATPLVGREEELDMLLRRWQQAKTGEGRVVLVSGEPGIGKSRLCATLSQRIRNEPHTRLRYFCSPYHQDSALYPFIIQLERAAGFTRDDTVEQRLNKLGAVLAPASPDKDEFALLAELLSLPNSAADLNLSPQRKREMLLEALLHQLEAVARCRPVLVVFEDAHWIDPTSREWLDLTLNRVALIPVLLIVTFRPEFQHAWSGQPHVTELALNRLGGRDGAALVERLAANANLSRETVDEIVERADGVPLFVEELTKAVVEAGDRDNRVAAVLAGTPLPELSIPGTLHASLIARLDRLGPLAKEVAQIGAVLGREFGYDLIEQMSHWSAAELRLGLERLAEAGLLFCRGVAPQSSYLFKHALVQDAAYGTLLRGRRQQLHARVAAVLEQQFADLVERQPELLAHHLTAGEAGRAIAQWLKAGQFAAGRLAHIEAIAHYGHGLALLSSVPETPDRDRQEILLQLALGSSLLTASGFSSVEAAAAYARARELCQRPGQGAQLFAALWGLWLSNQSRGVYEECRGLSKTLLDLTRDTSDRGLRLQAHHSAWTTSLFCGEPLISREHCLEGRHLYDLVEHGSHARLYGGHDPGMCGASMLSFSEWLLGYPDKALASSAEALAIARSLGHPFSLYMAHLWAAIHDQFRSETEASLRHIEATEAIAAEHRFSPLIHPSILRGGLRTAAGVDAAAIAIIRSELATANVELFRPYGFALLAGALAQVGDDSGATMAAADGLLVAAATGLRWWEVELYRLKAVSLSAQSNIDAAQACLQRALQVARQQHAKSLELRASTSLARLWCDQARTKEARELLAPVYGWFTEGFDTPDLQEARALLNVLNS